MFMHRTKSTQHPVMRSGHNMLVIFLISLVINYYSVGGIQSSFKKESTLFSTILNKSDSELNIDDLLFGDNEEIEENTTTIEENIAKNETGTNNISIHQIW